MGYIYSALWFLIAILLILRFRKEGAVIYVLSVYFIFLGSWWLADEFIAVDLLNGMYGWILRIVSLFALVAALFGYRAGKMRKEREFSSEKTDIPTEADTR